MCGFVTMVILESTMIYYKCRIGGGEDCDIHTTRICFAFGEWYGVQMDTRALALACGGIGGPRHPAVTITPRSGWFDRAPS